MSTTAMVAETRRTTGGPTPSGGAGPVLPLAQGLGELPAEFTANTCWSEAGRLSLPHGDLTPISLTPDGESFS